MDLSLQVKPFFTFTLAFIFFSIVGTLAHELGHIYVAHQLGFDTDLHYSSMNWSGKESSNLESFWISFGGPLQTMLTGSIGFWYCLGNKEIKKFGMKLRHWIGLFLGLFWLRPVFNLLQGVYFKIVGNHESYFSGDEAYLSDLLGWPRGTLSLTFAAIGLVICLYLVFRVVPKSTRFTFILSGIFGSLFGFWLWVNHLGPKLLP